MPWWDAVRAYGALAARLDQHRDRCPVHLQLAVSGDSLEVLLRSATVFSSLLCDGIGDSIGLDAPLAGEDRQRLLFGILQATGVRASKTEFVSVLRAERVRWLSWMWRAIELASAPLRDQQ